MIPHSIEPRIIPLEYDEDSKIVIFTGNKYRHKRFAYKIFDKFPNKSFIWYEIESKNNANVDTKQKVKTKKRLIQILRLLIVSPRFFFSKLRLYLNKNSIIKKDTDHIEKEFFKLDNKLNDKITRFTPIKISNPNTESVYEELELIKPFLIITLGGAKYSKRLTDYATGVALNQHDGWCPEYRGSKTIEWTLFYRDYSRLGSTIHILSKDMDAGDIIRRSLICPSPNDGLYDCFLRSIALGTELMIECINDIFLKKEIALFSQEDQFQKTFLNRDFNENIKDSIVRDFKDETYYQTILSEKKF